jgi:drug/metabolite transporter (DMT)-like permease
LSSLPHSPSLKGASLAIGAAVLFGLGVPLAKQLLSGIAPPMLSSLFYLGSAAVLSIGWICASAVNPQLRLKEAPLRRHDLPWLAGSIICGGLFAQFLEIWGINLIPASEASLLLNLEAVFTVTVAIVLFREHAGRNFIIGTVLLILGAIVLTAGPEWRFSLSVGSLCLILACLGWSMDNNLTRNISHANPVFPVMIKGFVSGLILLAVALSLRSQIPPAVLIVQAMAVGAMAYGLSLVLYVLAMRYIGAARTGAFFCTAPFVGAGASILFLHEPVTMPFVIAAALMAIGLSFHLTESHDHLHVHEPITHEHEHVHDEHHRHEHGPSDPPGEPHSHVHTHEALAHTHPHMPDIHHRHEH